MEIKIEKNLFQWEKDRKVFIECNKTDYPSLYVQVFNTKTIAAPLIPLTTDYIIIDDKILEQPLPITVLVCSEERVFARREFSVLKRPKPDGYNNTQQMLEKINKLIGGDI